MTEQQQKAAGIEAATVGNDDPRAMEQATADEDSLENEQAEEAAERHEPVVRPAREDS
ncbi:MAG: hypothetical protein QOJ60_147 [Actinomycetota bacterium]|jgi:hypothetical protein|nr:hypothetical protein [Actinomycetota bacterium]